VNETPLSDEEFKKFHQVLRQLALAAYPNPERKGCPGTDVLRDVASLAWPADHPGYDHIKHCSPCLREMFDLQEETWLAIMKRRHRRYKVAIAAIVVLTAGLWSLTWIISSRRSNPGGTATNVASIAHLQRTADLFDEPDALRGGDEPQKPFKTIYLPLAPLELKVILPRFSRPGVYQISICRDRNENSTLVKAVGRAVADEPRQIVTVMLDLSGLSKGSYWLSTRSEDEGGSYYFPLHLGS
jgi:hypothetical protein